jgi:L-fuculose-phosphate aldolase
MPPSSRSSTEYLRDGPRLRSELVAVSHALHRRGWVANHDGNVTARIGADRYLATPTSVSKGAVTENMLIVVDGSGQRVSGEFRPFSELVLHLGAYRARADVLAVVHAHPPTATAFAVTGRGLDRPILPEAVVSLGARIPLAAYAPPGSKAYSERPGELIRLYDAILLENHGALTVGTDLEQALLRMELVEHLARIEWRARHLGGVSYLPEEDVERLLDKRAKAGLGPRVRGLPDPSSGGAGPLAGSAADDEQIRRVVVEELKSMLEKD